MSSDASSASQNDSSQPSSPASASGSAAGGAAARQLVRTDDAPAPIGPYSQAVLVRGGATLYASGQVGLNPATGKMVDGGVKEQAQQVLLNMEAVLRAAGMGFGNVVRCSIFLVDMADFAAVNEVYATRFGASPPARATVAVRALPAGALVEIDCVAVSV